MNRVIAYIDGFNLYYGLRTAGLKSGYWLDVGQLSERLLRPGQALARTRYFSARIRGTGPKLADVHRQTTCHDALATRPAVTVHEGHFLEKVAQCKACGASWPTYEETMTDVNIAVAMLTDAFEDGFDTALVVSGDSDLTTPIRQVRERFPSKRVIVALPPKRNSASQQAAATGFLRIGAADIRQAQLPDAFDTGTGVVLRRPPTWR